MDFKDKMLIGFILLGLWLVVVLHVFSDTAHAADYAIVSFNDADHLAALQDSVVGVRDTVGGYYYNPDCPGDTVWFDVSPNTLAWLPDCEGMKSLYDSTYQVNWCYVDKAITCRRLVGVTVVESPHIERHPHGQFIYPRVPGEAIIFYEEVRQ